jgi:cell division protein FtsA
MRTPVTQSEIVVGLDLGTTKVSAVVGEVDADGITILGVGNVPCRGLRKARISTACWKARARFRSTPTA